jgi:tight adherence protein B
VSRRQPAFLLAVLAAALTVVPISAAKTSVRLTEAAGQFPDRAFILTLPAARPLAAGQVQVRENGQRVIDLVVTPVSAADPNQFGVVLVIDASNSMKGKAIEGAMQAAQLFVGHRAASQKVAVVTFNNTPQVALPFTADSGKILQTLAHQPELAYGTHIYDAVDEGISLLRDAHITAGSIVVLSDGADTGSKATLAGVTKNARKAHVRVFAVGLRSRDFHPASLRGLANGTSGSLSEATSANDLSRVYDQLGTELSHEYLLHYRSIQSLGAKVQVSVQVDGVPSALQGGYAAPTIPAPSFTSYHRAFGDTFWTSPFTMIVFGVFAVGLAAFFVFALLLPRQRTVQKRLAQFVSLAQPADDAGGTALPDRMFDGAEEKLEGSAMWRRFVDDVELADIQVKPAHIALWTFVATLLAMWFLAVVVTYAALLLAFVIPLAVWAYVRRKVEKKRALFAEELADNLAVLASAIRAGHSMVGALSVVVNDAPEPARSEFGRVVADEQLGMSLEQALDRVVVRMENADLKQVALVAALQRETGGSTAEVLDTVVETVRERQDLRRLVRTLTAAGRASRWIVTALPVVLILAIEILNPAYLHPLFSHTSGRILLVFATTLVIGGSLVIKRIVNIKV